MRKNNVISKAREIGYTSIGELEISMILFDETLRDMCLANSCGKSGTNWCCPPGCGEYSELKEMVLTYKKGILLQKVYDIEDSFDIEGMMAAAKDFSRINTQLNIYIREKNTLDEMRLLTAGGCEICEECTYPEKPCRHPDETFISIEACCINANELCESTRISYINGQNTVSYLALLLYK